MVTVCAVVSPSANARLAGLALRVGAGVAFVPWLATVRVAEATVCEPDWVVRVPPVADGTEPVDEPHAASSEATPSAVKIRGRTRFTRPSKVSRGKLFGPDHPCPKLSPRPVDLPPASIVSADGLAV